jgi:predicted metalloprotease with PDZ domain
MRISFLFFITLLTWVNAQNVFELDLKHYRNDALELIYTPQTAPSSDSIVFSFPATVPGTYDTQDYGRFVTGLTALDALQQPLPVKRKGVNRWYIFKARNLHHIKYRVEDVMDKPVRKHPIFQPAATAFDTNVFLFNGGGVFGYIEGAEDQQVKVCVKKTKRLYGITALETELGNDTLQVLRATSYHQLIDCPVMFTKPDTVCFKVNQTDVTLSVYDVQGKSRARDLYNALKRDMNAVAKVLPVLPVKAYSFIIYVDDVRSLGTLLNGHPMPFFKKLQLALKFRNLGLGALEHGQSSVYYLGDFGAAITLRDLPLVSQLSSAAIHEFMHIITPLGLHSECIGNFNYQNPKMSKHLWLYEGVTEYFAHYIKYKGGVYTENEFLKVMQEKLRAGASFPINTMAFTEMSARVLEPQYQKYYTQVYERGAALAFLLDAEIQRLTQHKKRLLDVVLQLHAEYGPVRSFSEDSCFEMFTRAVHPELKVFFDTYINGKTSWEPNKQLHALHLHVYDTLRVTTRLNPLNERHNDIKVKRNATGTMIEIIKTGPHEWAGFKPGDKINYIEFSERFAAPKNSDDEISVPLNRKDKKIILHIPPKTGLVLENSVLKKLEGKTFLLN